MKNWWEGTLNMWTPPPFAHLISVQFIGFIRLNIPSQDSCGKINFKRLTTSNAAHYSLLCSDLCSVVSSRAQTEIAVYKLLLFETAVWPHTVPHKKRQADRNVSKKGDLLQKCCTTVLKKDSYCVVITCHLFYLLFTDGCKNTQLILPVLGRLFTLWCNRENHHGYQM